MADESRSTQREFQLETRHLAAIILVIALLCIFSFMLGRWVERKSYGATPESRIGSSSEKISAEDVNRELTYFRTLEGTAQPPSVSEPAPVDVDQPVKRTRPADESATAAGPEVRAPEPPRGSVMIQVFASKDGSAALALKRRLEAHGYDAQLLPPEPGTGLRKVRVGPFGTKAEAERAAKRLQAEEGVRTWIP